MLSLLLLAVAQDISPPAVDAAALFSEIVEAQAAQPEVFGKPVISFRTRINLRERGEHPSEVLIDLSYQSIHGGVVEMLVDDTERGIRLNKGFDGRHFWMTGENEERVFLTGHEYTQDRGEIDQIMVLCEDLLLLLDLSRLQQSATDLSVLQKDDALLLSGKFPKGGKTWSFGIQLKGDSRLPVYLEISPPEPVKKPSANQDSAETPVKVRPHIFRLNRWHDFQGRIVPRVIEEFITLESLYPARIIALRLLEWASKSTHAKQPAKKAEASQP